MISLKLRQMILRRDKFRCQLCGATSQDGTRLHVDHKTPQSLGGSDGESNLWTLCEECNLGKGNEWDDGEQVKITNLLLVVKFLLSKI
jgi:5-methylcytosine-specific restriction endonuclease McrA